MLRIEAQRRRAGISLTPLIDVVFLLLIFFMLASTFARERALPLVLGAASGDAPVTGAILVRVDGDRLDLNGIAVGRDELAAAFARRAAEEDPPAVVVHGAPGTSVAAVVAVVDLARAAGLTEVALSGAAAP